MVLKRVLITAMGALGFGALAVGPAFAQVEAGTHIPAPRLFDDIAKCQGTARTAQGTPGRNETRSPLEIILRGGTATEVGTPIDRTTADADITLGAGSQSEQLLSRLAFDLTDCTNPLVGSDGYDRAIDLYEDYVSARNALPREDDDRNEESNLERAARLARADKDAFGGDIYNLVYDVLMKEGELNDAIEDYNDLVRPSGHLAALTTAYRDIGIDADNFAFFESDGTTPLSGTDLADALERLFGEDELQGYQAIDTTGEFNDAGVLQLEDTVSTTIVDLGDILDELQSHETALMTASNTLKAARDAGNLDTRALEEAERRATVARDHVQGELNRLTSIVRAYNFEYADDATIFIGTSRDADDAVILARDHRQVLTGFANINSQVDKAADDLETAVKNLDTANADARAAFGDANKYLNQLVNLHQFDENEAQAALDEAGANPAPSLVADHEDAEKLRMDAEALRTTYQELVGDTENPNPANRLLSALLAQEDPMTDALEDDDGRALIDAVAAVHESTETNKGEIDTLKGQLTDADGNLIDLTNLGDTEAVTKNTNDITDLDGRVADNEADIGDIQTDLYGTTSGQHADATACADGAGGLVNIANCADARSRHNEADIGDVNDKLMQKKEYIENLAAEIGMDPVTGEGTGEGGHSRIDMNEARSMANAGDIATNAADIMTNTGNIAMNASSIESNMGNIASNASNIASNTAAIGSNRSSIMQNAGRIGELSEDLDVVRAGVAASMALAGMPAINGRGISIGVGSFDGESAFAVGFQIQGEQASFKIGVTSSGGETGASAGVGFNF